MLILLLDTTFNKAFPEQSSVEKICCFVNYVWLYNMENGLEFREETLSQNVVAQRSPNTGSTVYYVAVYKESDSGLLYNPRLIVI